MIKKTTIIPSWIETFESLQKKASLEDKKMNGDIDGKDRRKENNSFL